MALSERLQILIDANAGGAVREFQKVGATADRELGRAENRVQKLAAGMTSFGAATAVTGGIIAVGLTRAASQAEQFGVAAQRIEGNFGQASGAVLQFVRNANDIGLSDRAAASAVAQVGELAISMGVASDSAADLSVEAVKLITQLSLIKGVSPQQGLEAINATLIGEYDSMQRLVPQISAARIEQEALAKSGKDTAKELTAAEKATAALTIVTASAADMIERAGGVQDTLALKSAQAAADLDDFTTAIGAGAQPIVSELASAAGALADRFNALSPASQQMVGRIGALGSVALVAGGGFAFIAGQALNAVNGLRDFSSSLRDAEGNLTRTGAAIRGLGVAATVVAAVYALDKALTAASESSVDLATNLDLIKAAENSGRALDLLIERTRQLDDGWEDLRETFGNTDTFVKIGEGADAVTVSVNDLEQGLADLANSGEFEEIKGILDEIERRGFTAPDLNLGTIGTDRGAGVGALNELLGQYEDRAGAAGAASKAAGADVQDFGAQAGATADDVDILGDALKLLTDRQKLASLGFDAAEVAAKGFSAGIDRTTKMDNLVRGAAKAGKAMRDLRVGFGLEAEAAKESKKETDLVAEAMSALNDALKATDPALSAVAIQFGALNAAGDAFASAFANLGSDVGSALDVGDSFRAFRKNLRNLPGDFDSARATLGRYQDGQIDAIRSLQQLGRESRDYLADLLRTGTATGDVAKEADRLRLAYEQQLAAVGLNRDQVREYIKLMGLTPEQVTTAIELSNIEQSRFKLNAYINLLDGKIPPELATQVIAQVNSGNLDGAANTLANFAATNPVKIETDTAAIDEAADKIKFELPAAIDVATLAMGGYTEAQMNGIDAFMAAGDAARDYLSILADEPEKARTEADKLRQSFLDQFAALGVTGDAAQQLLETIGLADWQIEAGITLAGFDETVFKIQTLLSLISDDLPDEKKLEIAAAIGRDDFDAALAALVAELPPPVTVPIGGDTQPAKTDIFQFTGAASMGSYGKAVVPTDANTTTASGRVMNFIRGVSGGLFGTAEIPVTAKVDTSFASKVQQALGGIGVPGAGSRNALGGLDGDPRTPRAMGGPMLPGYVYSINEGGQELFAPSTKGTMLNPRQTARMLSDSGGSSAPVVGSMTIVAPDPETAASETVRKMRDADFLYG